MLDIDRLVPVRDHVVIRRDEYEQTKPITRDDGTVVDLVRTHNPQGKRVFTGTVLGVGPGDYNSRGRFVPTVLRRGARVLWRKYAGSDFEMSASDAAGYCVCREDDVIAEITDETLSQRATAACDLLRDIDHPLAEAALASLAPLRDA